MSLLGDILLKVAEGRPLTGDERTSLRNLGNAAGNAGGLGHNIKPLTGNVSHLTAGGAGPETHGVQPGRGQSVGGPRGTRSSAAVMWSLIRAASRYRPELLLQRL